MVRHEPCAGCGKAINLYRLDEQDKDFFVSHSSRVAGYSVLRAFLHMLRFWRVEDETYWCTDCVNLDGR